MKSKLSKIMAGIIVCFAIMMMSNIRANAANANVNVSSASGSVGDTVTVDVTVTPEVAAVAQIAVAYDTNYLECVGGGNGGTAHGCPSLVPGGPVPSGTEIPSHPCPSFVQGLHRSRVEVS